MWISSKIFLGFCKKCYKKKKLTFSRKCVFFVTFFAEAQNFFGWHLQMLQKIWHTFYVQCVTPTLLLDSLQQKRKKRETQKYGRTGSRARVKRITTAYANHYTIRPVWQHASVAQWIEHQTSNLGVAGSSPAWGTNFCKQKEKEKKKTRKKSSHAGIWTRVLRVRAAYPNQLDYAGGTQLRFYSVIG
jgi:hypothetical protein